MKKILLLFTVIFIPYLVGAQISIELDGTVNKNISSSLKEGVKVKLKSIAKDQYSGYYKAYVFFDGQRKLVDVDKLDRISFTPSSSKEFWQIQAIKYGVYENITKNDMQYELRKELEEETYEFIKYTEGNNLIFKDSYLESYLYSLAYKILPIQIEDGRPGIVNVKVLKSVDPNAFIFPNGTMYLTTGLLSTLNSEEELIGVMAHEISHFVLDHSIININVTEQKRKKAEFWAAFATGLAAAADIYVATNNNYYSPGSITLSTAALAYSITSELNERMGLKYSREQEREADICASELLKYIDIDPTALSSALLKIKNFHILNGNYLSISGEGTHPSINERVSTIGNPTKTFNSPEYDKAISFVNSFNAIVQLNNHHLKACSNLVNRNIRAGVATEDDYIMLAMITTFMYDDKERNIEALSYINKAKELNVTPSINVYKQEAIILIRLNKYDQAKNVLNQYLKSLEESYLKLEYIKNPQEWSYASNYLYHEEQWTLKMINKVGKM